VTVKFNVTVQFNITVQFNMTVKFNMTFKFNITVKFNVTVKFDMTVKFNMTLRQSYKSVFHCLSNRKLKVNELISFVQVRLFLIIIIRFFWHYVIYNTFLIIFFDI